MRFNERQIALRQYYLREYEDFLFCVIRCGGCILRSQMCQLLFNSLDNLRFSNLVDDLVEARIFNKKRYASFHVLYATTSLLRHFNVKSLGYELNASRIKLSALIFEAYLQKGYHTKNNPAKALRQRIELSTAQFFLPLGCPQLQLMKRIQAPFSENGFSLDSINHQIQRMQIRYDASASGKNEKLTLSYEPDLFTLSCKNVFLSGVAIKQDERGTKRPVALVDIYYIYSLSANQLANHIIEAKRAIESILQNNCIALFTIHSHNAKSIEFEAELLTKLSGYPEFILPDTAKSTVKFKWYDTKHRLFTNIAPDSFV